MLRVWLHSREQEDLLDVVLVRQKHSQTIDSHAPSSSRWQTILKCLDECLIDVLSLLITVVLGFSLLLEALKLDLWVIQLSVGINDLMLVGEKFESLCEAIFSAVPLGERAHQLRMVDDEARADAL